jgi:hypothetical protein
MFVRIFIFPASFQSKEALRFPQAINQALQGRLWQAGAKGCAVIATVLCSKKKQK